MTTLPENSRRKFLQQSALLGAGLVLSDSLPLTASQVPNPKHAKLFEPLLFRRCLRLRNRVVLLPMMTWTSNDNGTVSDDEVKYYRRRVNDVGLVITGCTPVAPSSIGFTHQFAGYDDSFLPSLRKLATAAKTGGAPVILRISHAGDKALAALMLRGDIVSASYQQLPATAFTPAVACRALRGEEIQTLYYGLWNAVPPRLRAFIGGAKNWVGVME